MSYVSGQKKLMNTSLSTVVFGRRLSSSIWPLFGLHKQFATRFSRLLAALAHETGTENQLGGRLPSTSSVAKTVLAFAGMSTLDATTNLM